MTASANLKMDVVVRAQSGIDRQGSCCTHSSALLSISKVQKMFAAQGFFLTCRAKLRFRLFCSPIFWSTIFAKMDDQAHKPHRKSKERKDKKGKSGGWFLSPNSNLNSSAQADHHRIQRPIPKPLQFTGLANSKNRQPVQETSKKNDSMFPSSTDSPMSLHHGSWPSSALPAWARPPS